MIVNVTQKKKMPKLLITEKAMMIKLFNHVECNIKSTAFKKLIESEAFQHIKKGY